MLRVEKSETFFYTVGVIINPYFNKLIALFVERLVVVKLLIEIKFSSKSHN